MIRNVQNEQLFVTLLISTNSDQNKYDFDQLLLMRISTDFNLFRVLIVNRNVNLSDQNCANVQIFVITGQK